MSTQPSPIAIALEADLADRGIDQKALPALLARPGQPEISGGAISNWKTRGSIPNKHLVRLIEVFGPDSHLAKLRPELVTVSIRGEDYAAARYTDHVAEPPKLYRRAHPDELRPVEYREVRTPAIRRRADQSSMLGYRARLGRMWTEQLDSELQQHIEVTTSISGANRRVDFLSDTLAAEVTWMPKLVNTRRELPYAELVSLAVLKQATQRDLPDRQYVLLMMKVPPTSDLATADSKAEYADALRWRSEVTRLSMVNSFVVDCISLGVTPFVDVPPELVSSTLTAIHKHQLDLSILNRADLSDLAD